MAAIGYGMLGIAWLLGLVIVIKVFQKEGVMKGILALICELYAWIWGWQHAKENNNTGMMWLWTGLYIVGLILYGIGLATAGGGGGGGGGEIAPTPEGGAILRAIFHI